MLGYLAFSFGRGKTRVLPEYEETVGSNDWSKGMRLDVPLAVRPAMQESTPLGIEIMRVGTSQTNLPSCSR